MTTQAEHRTLAESHAHQAGRALKQAHALAETSTYEHTANRLQAIQALATLAQVHATLSTTPDPDPDPEDTQT